MRVRNELNTKWVQKTFRVREEAAQLYEFLEFDSLKKGQAKNNLFDRTINFSLDYINENNSEASMKEYKPKRKIRGFTLKEETFERFNDFDKINNFLRSEIVELCLYIYSMYNLSEKEIEILNLKEWGITIESK